MTRQLTCWRTPSATRQRLTATCPPRLLALPCRAASISTADPRRRRAQPCVVVPGFLKGQESYRELVETLRGMGCAPAVVPITKADWYPTLGGSSFTGLLYKMDAVVQQMHAEHGRVLLIGHSAGGFLARLLLGQETYDGQQYGRSSLVHTLVTLGTPHSSLEAYPFGRATEHRTGETEDMPVDAKGRSLAFANHFYPRGDSFPNTRVVCVCGKSVQGEGYGLRQWTETIVNDRAGLSPMLEKQFAFSSYQANCGRGDVWGDSITPLECAYLEGADTIELPDVWHNPGGRRQWYGTTEVLAEWLPTSGPAPSSPQVM